MRRDPSTMARFFNAQIRLVNMFGEYMEDAYHGHSDDELEEILSNVTVIVKDFGLYIEHYEQHIGPIEEKKNA